MINAAHLRSACKETFSRLEGWLIAVAGFLSMTFLAMILSNLKLLGFILREHEFSFQLKIASALQTIWIGRVTLWHEGGYVTLLLASAFGINVALIERYVRRQARLHRAAGASTAGAIVGLLGVGCAACGSALFAGIVGVGGALAALPLHGREFSWLGLFLVLVSTLSLAGKIAEPEACRLPLKN